jgi:hypothetical protein
LSDISPEAARNRRATWTARARFAGLVLVALAVGTVLPQLVGQDEPGTDSSLEGAVEAQDVLAWALHAEGGPTYISVFATGGKPSVALAVPAEVTINLPGQSLGTLADAAASGDPGLVEVALENLLEAPVDRILLAPLVSIGKVVDDLGGLRVRNRSMSGPQVVAHLSDVPAGGPVDQAFLRWQDVLDAVIGEGPGRPEALPAPLEEFLDEEPSSFRALPVVDIGGGLLRPDREGLAELLEAHFIRAATDAVRLVVLNGVGTPGIGEDVARILIPEGFRLVSSGNANTFRLEVTQIIASSRRDLGAAERARELLGAGEVSIGNQPTGLADVTVVVGRDFGGS